MKCAGKAAAASRSEAGSIVPGFISDPAETVQTRGIPLLTVKNLKV